MANSVDRLSVLGDARSLTNGEIKIQALATLGVKSLTAKDLTGLGAKIDIQTLKKQIEKAEFELDGGMEAPVAVVDGRKPWSYTALKAKHKAEAVRKVLDEDSLKLPFPIIVSDAVWQTNLDGTSVALNKPGSYGDLMRFYGNLPEGAVMRNAITLAVIAPDPDQSVTYFNLIETVGRYASPPMDLLYGMVRRNDIISGGLITIEAVRAGVIHSEAVHIEMGRLIPGLLGIVPISSFTASAESANNSLIGNASLGVVPNRNLYRRE